MLSVNEVIEIEDKLNEIEIETEKLNFSIQNALNEIEETRRNLIEKGLLDVLASSNLERIYKFIDIALDYNQKALYCQEEAKELTRKAREKLKGEAEQK